MRYVDFRDVIRNELRQNPAGLTWAELNERLFIMWMGLFGWTTGRQVRRALSGPTAPRTQICMLFLSRSTPTKYDVPLVSPPFEGLLSSGIVTRRVNISIASGQA